MQTRAFLEYVFVQIILKVYRYYESMYSYNIPLA